MPSQTGQYVPLPAAFGATTMKPLFTKSWSFARVMNLSAFSVVPWNEKSSGLGPVNVAGGKSSVKLRD